MTHLVIKHHSNLSLNFSSDNKELIFSDCEAARDGWSQRDWSCQTDWLWGVMTGNTLLTLLTLLTTTVRQPGGGDQKLLARFSEAVLIQC